MKLRTLSVGAIAVLLVAMPAQAGPVDVDVDFTGVGLGRGVHLSLDGHHADVFAGQLRHHLSNGTGSLSGLSGEFRTFCTELTQYVVSGTDRFDAASVADVPGTGPMGDEKAQAIHDLFAAADGRQFATESNRDNRDFAAAFQIAVWEVVNDYDGSIASLDIDTGSLQLFGLRTGVEDALADLFAGVGRDASVDGLLAITHDDFQDQLVMVPLPAPLALGIVGLAAVWWHRRRDRQPAAAA